MTTAERSTTRAMVAAEAGQLGWTHMRPSTSLDIFQRANTCVVIRWTKDDSPRVRKSVRADARGTETDSSPHALVRARRWLGSR
jgi:hypothetical protein